jgi:hypothetical protein
MIIKKLNLGLNIILIVFKLINFLDGIMIDYNEKD